MIRDRLILQQRELQRKVQEKYVPRKLVLPTSTKLITVLLGPRRAGKSTVAIQWLQSKGSFGYCNFDDEELVLVKDFQEIVMVLEELYEKPTRLLFDEVQNVPRWELLVNRLQRQGYEMVITGSNAHLLSRELATHLTGRHQQVLVFPFSFAEYAGSFSEKFTSLEIQQKLDEYVQLGGFPEPLLKGLDHTEYLQTLCNNVLYKDIVKRLRLRSVGGIDTLTQFLFSVAAREFSYNTLKNVTALKSVSSVEKYLKALEEAFLFFRVQRFSFKAKERGYAKKLYCVDTGFVQAKGVRFSEDRGRLYENVVAIELKKLEIQGKIQLFYWKNVQQEEVDFVIKEGLKVKQLIQVCWDVSDPKTKEREIRALLKAERELRCSQLLVLTRDYEQMEEVEWFGLKGRVQYMPLWKWLLEEQK